jgi:hypothetical protein
LIISSFRYAASSFQGSHRISQDLTDPIVLPRRGSLIFQMYKEHMELLVRQARSVPEDHKICWYWGLFLPWTEKWNAHSFRTVKLWEGTPSKAIRAYYSPSCASQVPENRERVVNFLRLSWRSNDRRERKNWYMSRQADKIVWEICRIKILGRSNGVTEAPVVRFVGGAED